MNRIKELRLEKNLTQRQLADVLKLNQTAVGKYERAELEPNIKTLLQLSAFFNVSVDYLIGNSDDFGNIVINSPAAPVLTEEEKRLLTAFRKLVPNMRAYMLANVEMLAAQNG